MDRSFRDNMPALGESLDHHHQPHHQRSSMWGSSGVPARKNIGGNNNNSAGPFSQSSQQQSSVDELLGKPSGFSRSGAGGPAQSGNGSSNVNAPNRPANVPQPPAPVEIEALALFKIMRHCRDSWPVPVNGLLVGLDSQKALEVTHTLEMPTKQEHLRPSAPAASAAAVAAAATSTNEAKQRIEQETASYQQRATEALGLANGDCLSVGWYQTLCSSGGIRDSDLFWALAEHQAVIADALVIGFDPEASHLGVGAFSAFRLSSQAVRMASEARGPGANTYRCLRDLLLVGRPLLVEVPLLVKNSLLAQIFLCDLLAQNQKQFTVDNCAALDGNTLQPLMMRTLNAGGKILDDVQLEQDALMKQQKENAKTLHKHREAVERRRIENEQNRLRNEKLLPDILPPVLAEPPSPLPTMLASSSARLISRDVASIAADDICRAFLVNELVSGSPDES